MTHHNNKPTGKEPNLNAKEALLKATWSHCRTTWYRSSASPCGLGVTPNVKKLESALVLIEEVEMLTPSLSKKTFPRGYKKDLEIFSHEFADYSADGELRRETYAKDFEARKDTVDKTLLHLLSELKVA
jgi:hypothetical protein